MPMCRPRGGVGRHSTRPTHRDELSVEAMPWILCELKIRGSEEDPRVVRVAVGDSVTLGRSESGDITLDDPSISARHAELRVSETRVEVRDLASRYGTFLDERRVEHEWVAIGPTDTLWLGDTQVGARLLAFAETTLEIVEGSRAARFSLGADCADVIEARMIAAADFPTLAPVLCF